jgi:maltooligosyltrehalose trehalohydrolase
MNLGSYYVGGRQCQFTLWAPLVQDVAVRLLEPERVIPLQCQDGYWQGTIEAEPGDLYFYQLDGDSHGDSKAKRDCADPASHSQPQGVHGASAIVNHQFNWTDENWTGVPLAQMIIYELHVGTFTPEGTFAAIIPRLSALKELGVNAIEIMPVAQFPGDSAGADGCAYRNWGYDGVFPYAVQHSYGGVEGFKQLVDACHQQGIAVVLDVVYNHLGPEGNYLWGLGTYFTDKYKTPWGSAVNFDSEHSDGVREYFVQNVLYWLENFHVDALRLDAIHAIYDFGAKHILQEMAEATKAFSQQQGRDYYLFAESDLNDTRILRHPSEGGYGMDAQWNDDFHHVLHVLLTGENQGYYEDYDGIHQLAKAYQESFVYTWNYSPHRQRHYGSKATECSPSQFVVFAQNHDQVGNRMKGDRLSHLLSFDAQKLAAAATLLSPSIPMLFMGEEYGETAPFLFFISHSDSQLVEAVRAGRKREFADFHQEGEPDDPQAIATFEKSKLNWEQRHSEPHRTLWLFYQKLLKLRTEHPALRHPSRQTLEVSVLEAENTLKLRRWYQHHQILCLLNISSEVSQFRITLPPGTWKKLLDSTEVNWGGTGSHLPDIMPTERGATVSQQSLELSPHGVVVYGSSPLA